MNSCQNFPTELHEKLLIAVNQLRAEKLNLARAEELFTKEKENYAKELKELKLKIHTNEQKIKSDETKLGKLRAEYFETLKYADKLETKREMRTKELQKMKSQNQHELNTINLEREDLVKEMEQVKQHREELNQSNKWAKILSEKELKAVEVDNDTKLEEDIKMLSKESARKMEELFEALKEIMATVFRPKQQQMKERLKILARITAECEDMEKKNKDIQKEIDFFKN